MLSSRRSPPPFGISLGATGPSAQRGYPWDLVTFPPPSNTYNAGEHPFSMTLQQIARLQCRLAYWDNGAQLVDPTGGSPAIVKNYGTPTPTDPLPTFQDRILNTMISSPLIVSGAAGSGSVNLQLLITAGCLINEDETLFYPFVQVAGSPTPGFGNTWILTSLGEFFPLVGPNQQGSDWVSFGSILMDDGSGAFAFSIPLWRAPVTGTVLAAYELDYFNAKPTQYLTA